MLSRPHILLCLVALALQAALVVLRGVGDARYLVPAIPALGALLAAGLVASLPQSWRSRASLALLGALVFYDAAFLWGGLVPQAILVWSS